MKIEVNKRQKGSSCIYLKGLGMAVFLLGSVLFFQEIKGQISGEKLESRNLDLVDIEKGKKSSRMEFLSQGKCLIYLDKDCSSCRTYVEQLKLCSEELKSRLAFVSINTPRQTRTYSSSLPDKIPLFVLRKPSAASIVATPTTQIGKQSRIGPLSCSQLEQMMNISD